MADVAKEAGGSHRTAFRVLGEHPGVDGDTRARAREAIDRYRRGIVARALPVKHSRTLAGAGIETSSYGPAGTVHGIEQVARAGHG